MTKAKRALFCLITYLLLAAVFLLMFRLMNRQYERRLYSVLGELSEELDEDSMSAVIDYVIGEADSSKAEHGKEIILEYGYTEDVYDIIDDFYNIRAIGVVFLILIMAGITGFFLLTLRNEHQLLEELKRINENIYEVVQERAEEYEPIRSEDETVRSLNELVVQMEALYAHELKEASDRYNRSVTFLENISHQIKIPISDVRLNLELMSEKKSLPSSVREELIFCNQQLDRINDLVSRLLKIGQLESGMVTFHYSLNDIQWMMDEIVDACNLIAGEKLIDYTYEEEVYSIMCDPVWLHEALLNVVRNCVQYSRDGGRVRVHIKRKGVYLNIIIQDEGRPIPVHDLPFIFDRFYRSHGAKYEEGFGIGLNLAQLIINVHHGTIEARDMFDGVEFEINVPFDK